MPIYEYVCTDCGHELEKLQKISDPPLADCPDCEQPSLKKKISAPGFRLAGSGWYETDFKADKQKNLSKPETADKQGGDKAKKADSGKAESSKVAAA